MLICNIPIVMNQLEMSTFGLFQYYPANIDFSEELRYNKFVFKLKIAIYIYLISFSLNRFPIEFPEDLLRMEKITAENIHLIKDIGYNYQTMNHYIDN